MFSFLREASGADGKPGPLSMRRLAAAACIITSIVSGIIALVIICRFIGKNPDTTLDWKAFIPLFIPCLAFLVGTLALLFFTTWEDIKTVEHAAAEVRKG
jgi:uncharacterized membrane protein YdcZ (DUF606 family)